LKLRYSVPRFKADPQRRKYTVSELNFRAKCRDLFWELTCTLQSVGCLLRTHSWVSSVKLRKFRWESVTLHNWAGKWRVGGWFVLTIKRNHRMLSSSWFAIDYFKLLKIPIWIQLQEWVLICSLELRKTLKTAENVLVEERLLNDIIGSYDPEEWLGRYKDSLQ